MTKRILLVSPVPTRFELTQHESFLKLPFVRTKGFFAPLPIATVAALTPDGFEVDLWDEAVHGVIQGLDDLSGYDLVGLTGFVGHLPRAQEIAKLCRSGGIRVVIGGPGVTKLPHQCHEFFDHLILGEAELIWPKFLADWKADKPQRVYRQIGSIDLAQSPPPRWESLADQVKYYRLGALFSSRGCPFDCDFCDVSLLYGTAYRTKPIDTVLEEVFNLEKLGFHTVVFCEDNFIGNVRYGKDLLRELIPLNNSFRRPLRFAAEMSMNMAKDEKLLELLADANFGEIATGIESSNPESLKEAHKFQNYNTDLAKDVKKVQSYGIPLRSSLMVGFDHDDKNIFDKHFQFLQDTCLTVPDFRIVMAPPGTPLWNRMQKEGRLLLNSEEGRFFGSAKTTNIIPKNMTPAELDEGTWNLKARVYNWESFALRARGFVSNVKRRPNVPKRGREWKLLFHFIGFLFSSLVDWRTRRIILGILWHTYRHAPFLLPGVARMIIRHNGYASTLVLRDEKKKAPEQPGVAVKVNNNIKQNEAVVPEGFKQFYEEIFSEIKENVCQGLENKALSGDTLIEIFTEFLRKRILANGSLTTEDRNNLMAFTKRTVAKKNSLAESNSSGFILNSFDISRFSLKRDRLSDEIFRAVEQELQMVGCNGEG